MWLKYRAFAHGTNVHLALSNVILGVSYTRHVVYPLLVIRTRKIKSNVTTKLSIVVLLHRYSLL